ncbi:ArsB/NhaD family transporter [Geobacillus sp. CAMR5420]|uniref:ArsB/NhaD family transporter n=1 Tax=Geobacillus TaxID=129337 RepID=UPI003220605A
MSITSAMVLFAFFFTIMLIYWHPKGMNEAIPATIGALIVIASGAVNASHLMDISIKVSGAAMTIISTLVMALVLESIGFFHWIASLLAQRSNGSGIRLFWYTNALCFLMTLFLTMTAAS